LFVAHRTPAAHPVGVALGSQSCTPLFVHDVWHDEIGLPLLCCKQHTVPAAQFAAPVHWNAIVAVSGVPAGGGGHVAPATHVKVAL
jgi:hypothetical protein